MKIIRTIAIIAALILGASVLLAQQDDHPITAGVDTTQATTDDVITLQVTVSGSNTPQPQMPNLEGFNVVGSSSSTQISIINNTMSSRQVTTYQLRPYQTGTLTIGAFSITLDGQTYSTAPIEITVTQGTGQPSRSPSSGSTSPLFQTIPGPSLFEDSRSYVEAEVDNETPYIGEQVTYTFRLYQSLSSFGQPSYSPPDFTGFWHDQQPEQNQYMTQDGSNSYRVTELKTYLFPTQAGEVTIDPATIMIQGGFFDPDTRLETDPLTLTVQALPANAPDDFNGAVGDYTLTASVDTAEAQIGDPVTLQLQVTGTGNINNLPDPVWEPASGWRSFDASSSITTQVTNGKLGGSKLIDHLLIPEDGGEQVLPAASLTFFDPDDAQYHTVTTDPITVTLNGESLPVIADHSPENTTSQDVTVVHVSPIRETNLTSQGKPLTDQPVFWLAWGVPMLMVLGSGLFDRRQRYLENNRSSIRRSRAYKQAQKAIKQAQKKGLEPYEAAGTILAQYIEAKLNVSLNGLTHPQLADLLKKHGIPQDHTQSALDTLYAIDTIRYGAVTAPDQILDDTAALITALEKEFTL